MVAADLHVHTTNSDGTLELAEVPAAARRAGLDAVAVTDHDRLHPGIDRPVAERDGVTLVHGIELRVESDAGRVDLLGYGARPTDALTETVERVQRDRVERGRAIIDAVEAHLGHEIPVEPERGIGRPTSPGPSSRAPPPTTTSGASSTTSSARTAPATSGDGSPRSSAPGRCSGRPAPWLASPTRCAIPTPRAPWP